jgi:hypothetical protein
MPSHLQIFLAIPNRAMPDGPPIFLVFVIAFLLVVNGFIALLRW